MAVAQMRHKEVTDTVNVNKLRGKMTERGVSVAALAEQLSLSSSSFYRRLSSPDDLTIAEVQTIKRVLDLNAQEATEIFFSQESHEMRQLSPDPQT